MTHMTCHTQPDKPLYMNSCRPSTSLQQRWTALRRVGPERSHAPLTMAGLHPNLSDPSSTRLAFQTLSPKMPHGWSKITKPAHLCWTRSNHWQQEAVPQFGRIHGGRFTGIWTKRRQCGTPANGETNDIEHVSSGEPGPNLSG